MYSSKSIYSLLSKVSLILVKIILDFCQKKYIYYLLKLFNGHLTKKILFVTIKKGDKKSQPNKQPENTLI